MVTEAKKVLMDGYRIASQRLTTAYASDGLRQDARRWLDERRNGVNPKTREDLRRKD